MRNKDCPMRTAYLILKAAIIMACLPMAGACTMIPEYNRPAAPVDQNWPGAQTGAAAPDNQPWKSFFTDPTMQSLIETALANNRDLRVSLLNIEKARGMYQIRRADLLPTVNVSGANQNQRLPDDLSPLGSSTIQRQSALTVGFTAFELDLFGRVRSLKEAALEDYLATEEAARAAQVSLVSAVASAYLTLAADQDQLRLAEDTMKTRADTYNLVDAMFKNHLSSQLEVSQAKSSLEESRQSVLRYKTSVEQDKNALVLLLGAPLPGDTALADSLDKVESLKDVPEGLPSQLLERRPDILSAEHRLKSANADIGAARANFFPTIGLTGNVGVASADLDNLFTGGQGAWLFAPSVTLPIFDTGRNIARLDVSEAERDIAVAQYEKSIQTAFREVADTLAQRATVDDMLDSQTSLVESNSLSLTLSETRYKAGVDSFMNVLDSQRTLFLAQQGLISTRLLREYNTLTLYKTLGGGWQ